MNKNLFKENLVIHTNSELYNLQPNQIIYITADGNYSNIHLQSGEEFVVTFQLGKIAEMIADQLTSSQHMLVRVGRGIIINMNEILYINTQRNNILMNKGKGDRIVLSAPHGALKKLMEYIISCKTEEETPQLFANAVPLGCTLPNASPFNNYEVTGKPEKTMLCKPNRKNKDFSDDDILILCGEH